MRGKSRDRALAVRADGQRQEIRRVVARGCGQAAHREKLQADAARDERIRDSVLGEQGEILPAAHTVKDALARFGPHVGKRADHGQPLAHTDADAQANALRGDFADVSVASTKGPLPVLAPPFAGVRHAGVDFTPLQHLRVFERLCGQHTCAAEGDRERRGEAHEVARNGRTLGAAPGEQGGAVGHDGRLLSKRKGKGPRVDGLRGAENVGRSQDLVKTNRPY